MFLVVAVVVYSRDLLSFECIISIVLDFSDENAVVPKGNNGANQPKVWTHFSRLKGP